MGRFLPAIAVASLLPFAALARTPEETPPAEAPAATTAPTAAPTVTPTATPTVTPTVTPAVTPTVKPHEGREVNAVRVGLGLSYFGGTKLVGVGTRKPYAGVDADLYVDIIRFPSRWLGFEIAMDAGFGSDEEIPLIFGLRSALDIAPFRWSGRVGGSFIVGVGGGVEVGGDRTWIDESVRAYPLVLARLRVLPTSSLALSASWQFLPIATSLRLEDRIVLQTHQIEAAMSYGYLQLGARAHLSAATGGDPRRTYHEARFGPFIGAVFY